MVQCSMSDHVIATKRMKFMGYGVDSGSDGRLLGVDIRNLLCYGLHDTGLELARFIAESRTISRRSCYRGGRSFRCLGNSLDLPFRTDAGHFRSVALYKPDEKVLRRSEEEEKGEGRSRKGAGEWPAPDRLGIIADA